jgi:hypothetical protein
MKLLKDHINNSQACSCWLHTWLFLAIGIGKSLSSPYLLFLQWVLGYEFLTYCMIVVQVAPRLGHGLYWHACQRASIHVVHERYIVPPANMVYLFFSFWFSSDALIFLCLRTRSFTDCKFEKNLKNINWDSELILDQTVERNHKLNQIKRGFVASRKEKKNLNKMGDGYLPR